MNTEPASVASDAQKIAAALDYASQIDFSKAVAAFNTANLAGELQTIDDVLRVIGVFVPPVAVAANDLAAALGGFELLMQFSDSQIPQVTRDLEQTIEDRFE